MILDVQYLWMIFLNYFIIRNCSSHGPVVENDVEWLKIDPKLKKGGISMFSERCHGNTCYLNVIVVPEFISRDLYLLLAILVSSKFQNSIFYQHMRPKSGLKFPRPLAVSILLLIMAAIDGDRTVFASFKILGPITSRPVALAEFRPFMNSLT